MTRLTYDVVVVGGGISGVCAAIASARHGARTALIHNRPVFGGNASSEIRMHICGADHHASRPNARETGILEEILLENKRVNPGASYAVFDLVLWGITAHEPRLDTFLNTHMLEVRMSGAAIESVAAACLTSEQEFEFHAPLFIDATGDGTLGAKAGAKFLYGREGRAEFGEPDAPEKGDGCTMGSSLLFAASERSRPVAFTPPSWAKHYSEADLALRDHSDPSSGYWWIELGGGDKKIIEDAEAIRDDLLASLCGVWDHIKNGGEHGAQRYGLDWVGFLPGKRESRRLLGDYVLTEQDCVSGRVFEDAVAYGGWPIDAHVAGGIESGENEPTSYIHLDDVYTIPYRCLYSINVPNLFLAGRAISCSHLAFASARVMGTCAVAGQAAGTAAAMAAKRGGQPRGVPVEALRQALLRDDCYIPGARNEDPCDLARGARARASSQRRGFEADKILSGVARPVGDESNAWKSAGVVGEWLSVGLSRPAALGEVQIRLDSNLSREITISLSRWVLSRQAEGPPPELVRDMDVEFLLRGEVVRRSRIAGNARRFVTLRMEEPVLCDQVRFVFLSTHGADHITVYEVRLYAA